MRCAVVLGLLLGATACAPPVAIEEAFEAGEPFRFEWSASGNAEELWLDVKTTGGRSLSGPVEVYADQERVAGGAFSLQKKGMVNGGGTHVLGWASSPSGARGQVELFALSPVAANTPMAVTAELSAGDGASVERLVLQVRRD